VRYWFPIDLYVGGVEHTILHLVYARFWTKVMRDLGLVTLNEPVVRLFPQGMVHKDGEVMSKSKGNTIAPDDIIVRYGADTLRLYILFVAPPDMAMEWKEEGIEGAHRFVQRVWRLVDRHAESFASGVRVPLAKEVPAAGQQLRRKLHQTIAKVGNDIEKRIHLNTAVAALMELVNELYRTEAELAEGPGRPLLRDALETLVLLLSPFTPHMCEELWKRLGRRFSIVDRPWPVADPELAREEQVELGVQINGRLRGRITVAPDAPEETVQQAAHDAVAEHLAGKQLVRSIVVPGRLVNLVVK